METIFKIICLAFGFLVLVVTLLTVEKRNLNWKEVFLFFVVVPLANEAWRYAFGL